MSRHCDAKALSVKLAHTQTSTNFVKIFSQTSLAKYEYFLCRSRYVFIKSLGFKSVTVENFLSSPFGEIENLFNLITSHAFLNEIITSEACVKVQNLKALDFYQFFESIDTMRIFS